MEILKTARIAGLSLGLFALGAGATFLVSHSTTSKRNLAASPAHPAPAAIPERGFYENLQVLADEAEGYQSLAAMADAADLVVVGKLSNFRLHRAIGTGSAEYVVHMAAVDVTVLDEVRGGAEGERLLLEFLLPGRGEDVAAKVAQEQAKTPADPVLLLLRETEPGTYRLVNSLGLWTVVDGAVAAPLLVRHSPVLPRPRGAYTPAELAQAELERAARPAHLRNKPSRSVAPNVSEPHGGDTLVGSVEDVESAPYATDLAGIRNLDTLAAKLRD